MNRVRGFDPSTSTILPFLHPCHPGHKISPNITLIHTTVLSLHPVPPPPPQVEARNTTLSRPDQPLVFEVRFAPQRVFHTDVEFVVHKSTGGRWRFPMQLTSTEPELDGTITVEASMDCTAYVPIFLYSGTGEPASFTASFTSSTPLQFTVSPPQGVLPPRPAAQGGGSGSAPLFGTTSIPAGPASGPDYSVAPLWLAYTCRDFGKVLKGRLFVQTPDGQFSFDVRGKVPDYVAPKPEQFEASVDHRLSPEMEAQLKLAHAKQRGDSVVQNIKAVKKMTLPRR